MKTDLQIALSRLASKELQEKYCVNGTPEEYLLPEELLDSAVNWATSAVKSAEFNQNEVAVINRFLDEVNGLSEKIPIDDENTSADDLISRNPEWRKVRDAAGVCLEELGLEPKIAV